jgi:hypothetical protein
MTEVFGPVLGIMKAKNLNDAIRLQNAPDYGLTAGIHSLDNSEVLTWIDGVNNGNLYVNRGITGAIVARQPFGGFKRSSVGPGLKAGGSSYLTQFGTWANPAATAKLSDAAFLKAAKASDDKAWKEIFAPKELDGGDLEVEGNYRRYLPANLIVRVGSTATQRDVDRVLAAIKRSGFRVPVSVAPGFMGKVDYEDKQVESGTDFENNLSVQVSVNNGSSWYNATNGNGLFGIQNGSSLVYRVLSQTTSLAPVYLLDMNIEYRKTFQGAWALSAIVGGYLVERQYFGYTKREATQKFHAEFAN